MVFGVRFIGFSGLTMMVGKSVTDVSMKVYKKVQESLLYSVSLEENNVCNALSCSSCLAISISFK